MSDHVSGRSRSAVAAVRALAAAGHPALVTACGRPQAAARSRDCAGVLAVPPVDSPEFRTVVEDHLRAHPGLSVLPASDAVLVALELPGAELVDKAALPARAAAAELPVPASRSFATAEELLECDDVEFPLVVKAAVKTRPDEVARRADSRQDLRTALAHLTGELVVQPFLDGTMRAVCGVLVEDRLLAVVHQRYERIWPPDAGTASAAVTTAPDLELEERLPALLKGHTGVFQVQLVGDAVIDVNPRAYGSLPLALSAGANLPAIATAVATGGPPPMGTVRGRPGVRYRWLEGDLRRLLHDRRTGTLSTAQVARALMPVRRTAHSVESLRDPAPMLLRVTDALRRRTA